MRLPMAQVTAPPMKAGSTTKVTVQNSHWRQGFDGRRDALGLLAAKDVPDGYAGTAVGFRLVMIAFLYFKHS